MKPYGLIAFLMWNWISVHGDPNMAVVHWNRDNINQPLFRNHSQIDGKQAVAVNAFDKIRKSVRDRIHGKPETGLGQSTFSYTSPLSSDVADVTVTDVPNVTVTDVPVTDVPVTDVPVPTVSATQFTSSVAMPSFSKTLISPSALAHSSTSTSESSSLSSAPSISNPPQTSDSTSAKVKETKTFQIPVMTVTETPKERVKTVKVTQWVTPTFRTSSYTVPQVTTLARSSDKAEPAEIEDKHQYLELLMFQLYSSLKLDKPVAPKDREETLMVITKPSLTTDIARATASTEVSESNKEKAATNKLDHGAGAKDILNMKPLPYKLSVKPQFQNHQQNVDNPNHYGKPKIHYMFHTPKRPGNGKSNPDIVKEETKEIPKEPQIQSIEDTEEKFIEEVSSEIKVDSKKVTGTGELNSISAVDKLESTTERTDNIETSTSRTNTIATEFIHEDDDYVYKYVYEGEEDETHSSPLDILHVPKSIPEDTSNPFKTFKSTDDLNASYKKEQAQAKGPGHNGSPRFQRLDEDLKPNRRKDHTREKHHRPNDHKFKFDLFGFHSSSNKVSIAWCLVITSLLVPAYL